MTARRTASRRSVFLAASLAALMLTTTMIGDAFGQSEAPTEAVNPGDIVTNPDLARMRERQRRIETLSALFARQNRVYRIGYRLLYAAVDMCPDRLRVAAGFTYANAYMFHGSVRTAASAMGYTHRVSVVDVAANGAATRSRSGHISTAA